MTVGVAKVTRKSLQRQITLSSELVPFQEIDVYAKESGFVKRLLVDYGSRVQAGQLMAVLEIPELEAQLQEDQAAIKNATDEVSRADHQLKRYKAQYTVFHLEYTRLNGVFQSQPGLVAQQEVDDAQGKDLAARRRWMRASRRWRPRKAICWSANPNSFMTRRCSTTRASPRRSPVWLPSGTPTREP